MSYDLLQAHGRRLRWGMVGGGKDSLIGEVHRLSARLDNRYDLVAGAFSIDPDIARQTGAEALLAPDRQYIYWKDMVAKEAARPDGIEVVTVATPPHLHAEISEAFLMAGIDVICEKPMTRDLSEARHLKKVVDASDRMFAVVHCYNGYPLVREARALVQQGAIGDVRQVECDFPSGPFMTEQSDREKRHWRFRPEFMGKEAILGELGAHCFAMMKFVTGQVPVAVSANMTILTEGRETYDDVHLIHRFANGALGRSWLSFVAAGNEHGLSFRVHGTMSALIWRQQQPDALWLQHTGKPAELITPGFPDRMTAPALQACRLREGHPEGYVLAFANLYKDFADIRMAGNLGRKMHADTLVYPTVDDGLDTMRIYDAASRSQAQNGAWIEMEEA